MEAPPGRSDESRSVDPRFRVVYLAVIAITALLIKDARVAAGAVVVHAILWLVVGLGGRRLVRQVTKLWGFAAFILFSYAIVPEDPRVDRWVKLDLGFWAPHVNVGGMETGGLMLLRVVLVVLASQIARAGDSRAIAIGLRKLGAPDMIAAPLDAVLVLLGGSGGGGGRGRGGGGGGGGGGGRGRGGGHEGDEPREGALRGFWNALKKIARGDVGPIVDRMDRHIARAEQYMDENSAEEGGSMRARHVSRDIAIISGLSLTMLGIKALKLLPNIPFAPGHKLVLLTPLYVVAALKTRTRIGATLTGLVMGSVAFLLGDGRYGIFEIAKHVAPGIICDLFVLVFLPKDGTRKPGAFTWSLLGGLMGIGRFATIFTITLAIQPPALAWAFLVPGLIVHTTFGVLSGLVSSPLIKRVVTTDVAGNEAGIVADVKKESHE